MANKTTERPAYPPFCGGPVTSTTDYCSREGAILLADKIKAAWQRVGIVVETRVVPVTDGRGATLHAVEMPNLTNGLPVRFVAVPT